MADVAETAIIDHGSHIVGIPVKGHFQEAGRTQNEEHYDRGEGQGQQMVEQGAGQKVLQHRREYQKSSPKGETVGGGREAKGDWGGGLGGGATVNGLGLERHRRRISGVTAPRNI